jgi:hypothetical protein
MNIPGIAGILIYNGTVDGLVKSRQIPFSVIPADPGLTISMAGPGIQSFRGVLDPGVRRGDDMKDFLRVYHRSMVA